MPIALQRDSRMVKMVKEPFKDEGELKACLERCPYLVLKESEPAVATVQTEVALPAAGSLDLLLVDKEGLPVAVEVKLARNAQSRREVVAQAFDYVADLSNLTFDELDEIVDGALGVALLELVGAEQSTLIRRQCATNLRAGRIRLVIAVDSAPEDLIRIVRFITEHSDIDVRLVCISKFDDGRILVPRILVSRASDVASRTLQKREKTELDPAFSAVTDAYDRIADEEWRTRGHARNYRQVRADEWPGGLHYEFVNRADEIGVELHLESDAVALLAPHLAALDGQELTSGLLLEWDPRWCRGRGRLMAKIAKTEKPEVAVKAMQALMARTQALVEEHVKR
ncbi:MAG: hypothetical protein ONB17_09560 [candidate division KSB1 bacterium]|nr:hypothetical protein [candidate division KSB1 bacterium]MDZ7393051.1 hypothetical protein [candidate division KSB1 bacterium]